MMTREVVSLEELNCWLTSELISRLAEAGIEPPGIVRVSVQYPFSQPDTDGCNWSPTVVPTMSNLPTELVTPHVLAVVELARKRFNVNV